LKNNSNKSCVIITGNHGIGKTILVETVLQSLNYDYSFLDFNAIKKVNAKNSTMSKNIKDIIYSYISAERITNALNGVKKKKALVVDKLERITLTTEKKIIQCLQKENELYWHIPIIFISNTKHDKLISDLKKICIEIRMEKPTLIDLMKLSNKIIKSEKLNIKDQDVVSRIVEHSQYDIRKLIYIFQDLYYTYHTTLITYDSLDIYEKYSQRKDLDINLYDAADKIINNYDNVNTCISLYQTEKILVPLMIHENYHQNIISRKLTHDQSVETVKDISEILSAGDLIENYLFGNQNWDMQEIHGLYACSISSYYLNRYKKYTTNRKLNPIISLKKEDNKLFTRDLSKTSIKNINKKNINNAEKSFKNKTIFDYINITFITNNLLNTDRINECADVLRDYNFQQEHIESLFKIDKIKSNKSSISPKLKTELFGKLF
jgi:DNA polymerase III delta prime subunit